MDPLSAISVAAAVIQFVDFGSGLLRDTVEIYRSTTGQSRNRLDIRSISRDLSALADEVEAKSSLTGLPAGRSSEDVFIGLCRACKDVAKELQECVSDVSLHVAKNPRRAFQSFVTVLKERRSDEKVEALRSTLYQVQQRMTVAVLIFLWGEAKRSGREMTQVARRQADILGRLERIQEASRNDNPSAVSKESNTPEGVISRDLLECTTWDLLQLKFKVPEWPADLVLESQNPTVRDQDKRFRRRLLSSLLYDNLNYREEAISEAHTKTLEWIFHEPEVDEGGLPAWSSFPDWLEGESRDVYWITGKPGAGKSTLVKFILGHQQTIRCLEKWAHKSPILVLGYYFWNAGSEMQKSHEGLLRAFLFNALNTRPDLTPIALTARWTMMKLYGEETPPQRWTLEELMTAFRQLVAEVTKKGRLVLIIDGLDEFEGDHRLLVDLIRDIGILPGLKICVSSRPWNVFRDAYLRNPSLRVENLTRGDIKLYVQDHFGRNEAFHELRALQASAADSLVKDVVDKAQGVFLWVKVVIAALLDGLTDGDQLSDLQKTLDGLPEDLSQLFQAIWDRIDSRYHNEASQLFQILEVASKYPWGLSVFALWLADANHPIGISRDEVNSVDRKAVTLTLRRRLSSRTKGLVEIHENHTGPLGDRVDYMHRSFRDWIVEQSGQLQFSSTEDFDPYLRLLKGQTLQIAGWNPSFWQDGDFWNVVSHLFGYASHVRDIKSNTELFISVLDRVDAELTRLALARDTQGAYNFYGEEFKGVEANCLPHWSCLQFQLHDLRIRLDADTPQTNYIGFTAQIPLASYVRAKILADPRQLSPTKEGVLSPAEALTFGLRSQGAKGDSRPMYHALHPKSREERLELLRFLLKQGADLSLLRAKLQREEARAPTDWWLPRSRSWRSELLQTIEEGAKPKLPRRALRHFRKLIQR